MRLLCTAPHGNDDPAIQILKDQVEYLREELKAERARTQHYRDAYEALVDFRTKQQLEFLRGDVLKMQRDANAPPAPPAEPSGDTTPAWLQAQLAAGGHLEEDHPTLPENYGRTAEELEEATLEQESERREQERLAAAGHTGMTQ